MQPVSTKSDPTWEGQPGRIQDTKGHLRPTDEPQQHMCTIAVRGRGENELFQCLTRSMSGDLLGEELQVACIVSVPTPFSSTAQNVIRRELPLISEEVCPILGGDSLVDRFFLSLLSLKDLYVRLVLGFGVIDLLQQRRRGAHVVRCQQAGRSSTYDAGYYTPTRKLDSLVAEVVVKSDSPVETVMVLSVFFQQPFHCVLRLERRTWQVQ